MIAGENGLELRFNLIQRPTILGEDFGQTFE